MQSDQGLQFVYRIFLLNVEYKLKITYFKLEKYSLYLWLFDISNARVVKRVNVDEYIYIYE